MRDGCVLEGGEHARVKHFVASLGYHGAVVNAKAFVGGEQMSAALLAHLLHHLLQTEVAADAAHYEHLARVAVGHGALRYFDQHGEHGLLQREAQVLGGVLFFFEQLGALGLDEAEQAAERDVHALDAVGQLKVLFAFFGQLLNVVARRWIIAQLQTSRKSVQTIAHRNVNRFTEYSVAFVLI